MLEGKGNYQEQNDLGGGLDGLRRALHHLFESIVYRPAQSDAPITQLAEYRESVVDVPGAFLEPHLRPQAIEGYADDARPIVKRMTLAQTTESEGFPTYSVSELVFGPIPVECPS